MGSGPLAEKLVSRDSYPLMFQGYATADWGDAAAYGWFLGHDKSSRRYMGFLGGINGFAAVITRYPDERVLIVVLSNFSFAPVADIANDLSTFVFQN